MLQSNLSLLLVHCYQFASARKHTRQFFFTVENGTIGLVRWGQPGGAPYLTSSLGTVTSTGRIARRKNDLLSRHELVCPMLEAFLVP